MISIKLYWRTKLLKAIFIWRKAQRVRLLHYFNLHTRAVLNLSTTGQWNPTSNRLLLPGKGENLLFISICSSSELLVDSFNSMHFLLGIHNNASAISSLNERRSFTNFDDIFLDLQSSRYSIQAFTTDKSRKWTYKAHFFYFNQVL